MKKNKAECHPDKDLYSLGLCRSCYEKGLRARNPEFHQRQKDNKNKWVSLHRKKVRKDARKYHRTKIKGSKEKAYKKWSNNIYRIYGITDHEYMQMLEKQNGVCLICGRSPSKRRLHIDHDHKTNKIRGLLCFRCNYDLSWFNNDINNFWRAIEYLINANKKN